MTIYREKLIDCLARLYGFENPIVIEFCQYCERWADNEKNDTLLTYYVETNEKYPAFELLEKIKNLPNRPIDRL